jgi:RNA recognition motif-containing protein
MSVRLYVGNLPKEVIERQALQDIFADASGPVATKLIKDRKTGKCRGFAFVTVPSDELADELIEKYNGQSFMDSPLKIEKALPRAKGKEQEKDESQPKAAPQPNASSGGGGGGKRQKNKRSRPQGQTKFASDSDSVQPDPRWAGELAKLKEMLSAQTTNS